MAFTDDQQKKIKQVLGKYRANIKAISAEHRAKVLGAVQQLDEQKMKNLKDKIQSA